MKNKDKPTIEDLLAQIDETLKVIQNHKGPIHLSPDLLADIDKLESKVSDFKETSQPLFDLLEIDVPTQKKEILESSEVRSSDKQVLKHAEDIEKNARAMKLALTRSRGKKARGQHTQSKDQIENKEQIRARRKLFKSIGGDQKWKPL
jgi:hypothetical protein